MMLATVVLNWNGRDDTLRCLDSLETACSSGSMAVIVVDNGSHDDSVAVIRQRHPHVEIIETKRNLGYAGGNNEGIRRALELDCMHICVLNNDTVVPPGAFDGLLSGLLPDMAVSPAIARLDGSGIWYQGATRDANLGLPVHEPGSGSCLDAARPGLEATDFLTGCCILAERSVWERVGGFDERYFLIFEDSDWSLRAHRMGIQLFVAHGFPIRHAVSASFERQSNDLGLYYWTRNSLQFLNADRGNVQARDLWKAAVRPACRDSFRCRPRQALARMLGMTAYLTRKSGAAGLPARALLGRRSSR